ncbi:MAG TPA: penicillin-binding transpeptidase domain-containing protein [Oligoflexia bacterium]|nr:penicillin-binding transpeptidase domain-containing protein [Oligoflexia bacterium]
MKNFKGKNLFSLFSVSSLILFACLLFSFVVLAADRSNDKRTSQRLYLPGNEPSKIPGFSEKSFSKRARLDHNNQTLNANSLNNSPASRGKKRKGDKNSPVIEKGRELDNTSSNPASLVPKQPVLASLESLSAHENTSENKSDNLSGDITIHEGAPTTEKIEELSSLARMLVSSTQSNRRDGTDSYKNDQFINHIGPFLNKSGDRYFERTNNGNTAYLTLNVDLQEYATDLLKNYKVPWGALVAINPSTGRVLAMAGHSETEPMRSQKLVAENTFPAASLFKIITAAAAVETSGLVGNTPIRYRGGTYSLDKHNYLPNSAAGKQEMTLGTALAKSCNPAFARVALNNLSVDIITQYAHNFGFYKQLAADFPVSSSTLYTAPDSYSLARTAAGFGEALISPVHAAAMIAAVGNRGLMMRPYIVDSIKDKSGLLKMRNEPKAYEQVILESTAQELIAMMESTTTEGTGRKQFHSASHKLKQIPIASKTGTLTGTNPKGRNYWFVAVAPSDNPSVALAALVVDDGTARVNGVGIGRKFLEKYFDTGAHHYEPATRPVIRASVAKRKSPRKSNANLKTSKSRSISNLKAKNKKRR